MHRANHFDYGILSLQCEVTMLLWVNDLPPPTFTSGWFTLQSQNGINSHKTIQHNLGKIPARVQVQVEQYCNRMFRPMILSGFEKCV